MKAKSPQELHASMRGISKADVSKTDIDIGVSRVEITEQADGFTLTAKQDIDDGDIVLVERSDVFHTLTIKEMNTPASDACFLVCKILKDPKMRVKYDEFGLDTSLVIKYEPSQVDKKYLIKLGEKTGTSFEEVLKLWQVVCAHYVLASSRWKVRTQLSKYINRINHSCYPNSEIKSLKLSKNDFTRRLISLRAVQSIQKGDKITFCYMPPSLVSISNVAQRREILKTEYKFVCECDRCVEEALDVGKSNNI
ncbi:SET domain-containing protein [Pseudoalteromonas rhizosphaerae]|uniref:SET domain-containing protein n=1 Tax=Pseudoalteromonas rhizosphaerae TaxID=2518973 RepID=UPI003703BCC1